jgi:SAM-dependent methyltransferase
MSAPSTGSVDFTRLQEFTTRVMADFSAALTALACSVGDALGLFRVLADHGPTNIDTLARRTGFDERHVREWLQALTAAGYLKYEPATETFWLPPEHAELLANEGSPTCLAGGFQLLLGLAKPLDRLIESIRNRTGLPQSAYDDDLRSGMERMSAPWFDNFLIRYWLPAVPGLVERLERGIRVADLGCGGGRALIKLASSFPASIFTGFDLYPAALAQAKKNLADAGLAHRVQLSELDISGGLPGQYDLITTFNSLHDMTHTLPAMRAIGTSLAPDGIWLILEGPCSDRLEENIGSIPAILYTTSLLYNTPVAMKNGGEGAGAMAFSERRLGEMAASAGFAIRRLSTPMPMHALYAATVA